MPDVIKANKREVPGAIPPLAWFERIREYEGDPGSLLDLPIYHEVMEYLSPAELLRFKAKWLIWLEVTGEYPDDLSYWWEVRMARRRGDIPRRRDRVVSMVDDAGVLHCGHCGARWSASDDGHQDMTHCNLCDAVMQIETEESTHG